MIERTATFQRNEPLTQLQIRHRTTYEYRQPVRLGQHRLMLRPRESRDLRILSLDLDLVPSSSVMWAQDVFGNAIATASFSAPTARLDIESRVEIELTTPAWPIFAVSASALSYPFRYANDEWADLGALAVPQYQDGERLRTWAEGFVLGPPTDTLALLKDLSAGVSRSILYQSREEEGTQTPNQTLDRGWGSCRDFAVLFAEAVRSLGFGARIVSGYLHNPGGGATGSFGSGSTHAWTEVYVPGAGWITFDPTNRSMGGANLVPVAVGRGIEQIVPVAGSFTGMSDAFAGLTVEVSVSQAGA